MHCRNKQQKFIGKSHYDNSFSDAKENYTEEKEKSPEEKFNNFKRKHSNEKLEKAENVDSVER